MYVTEERVCVATSLLYAVCSGSSARASLFGKMWTHLFRKYLEAIEIGIHRSQPELRRARSGGLIWMFLEVVSLKCSLFQCCHWRLLQLKLAVVLFAPQAPQAAQDHNYTINALAQAFRSTSTYTNIYIEIHISIYSTSMCVWAHKTVFCLFRCNAIF